MTRHTFWLRVLLICAALPARTASAADLRILPGDITLTGPHASQRLVIAPKKAAPYKSVV